MRTRSLRTHLALLVAGALLPMVLFAAVMVYREAAENRATAERALADTAATLALAVDGKLEAVEAVLRTLAASPALAERDFAAFHSYAAAVGQRQGSWVILIDSSRQQIVNTRLPFGTALPRVEERVYLERASASGRTVVTDMFTGAMTQRPIVTSLVPVVENEQVVFTLAMPVLPERLSRLLEAPGLHPLQIAALVDSQGVVVARNRDAARYVGQRAPDWFLAATSSGGLVRGAGVDGQEAVAAYQRLASAPWTVVVGMPAAALRDQARSALAAFGLGGLALAALAIGLAAIYGRRLAAPIRALASAAPAVLRGGQPASAGRSRIREIAALDGAMRHAAAIAHDAQAERERAAAAEARAAALAESAHALRASEERLRLFVEHAPAAIAMFDRDMRYVAASRRYLRDYGLSGEPQSLAGRSHYDVFPELPARWRDVHRRCLAGAVERADDDPFPRADGHTDWVRWEIRPWRRADDEVGGVLLFSEVVTARHEAATALRESELRLRVALDGARLGLFDRDLRTGIGYWSETTCALFGLAPTLTTNTRADWERLIHPDDRPRLDAAFAAARDGEPYDVDFRVMLRDGGVRWIASRGEFERDANGEPVRIVGVCFDVSAHKAIEAALRESERRFRLMADSAPVLIWVNGLTGCEFVNQAYLDFIGRPLDAVRGMGWAAALHPDDAEAYVEAYRTAFAARAPFAAELRFRRADGVFRWLRSQGTPRFAPDGAFVGYIGCSFDISEIRDSEAALRENEERLRLASEAAGFGVHDFDVAAGRSRWSDGLRRLVGLHVEGEVPLAMTLETVHPEDRDRVRAEMEAITRRLGPYEIECRIRRPDGAVRWVLDRGEALGPLDPATGRAARVMGTLIDITERKRTEGALRESELRFRTLVESIGDVFWLSDLDSKKLVYASPAYAQIWGRDVQALYDRFETWIEAIHADDRERVRTNFWRDILAGTYDEEYRVVRPDGSVRWVRDRGRPLGVGGLVAGAAEDVTERKRAEQALAEARGRLDAVLNNATVAIFLMDERQHCAYMNAAAERLTGYTLAETLGRPLHDVVHHTRPDGHPYPLAECPIDRAFPQHMHVQGEEIFVHKDGHFYPVAYTASPVRDERADIVGTIIEARDIAEQKKAEQRQLFLMHEVDHRAKNLLAVVMGLLRMTRADSIPGFVETAQKRIQALARVHSVLAENAWDGAPLATLAARELAPYRDVVDRVRLSGPAIVLQPQAAQPLGMVLHELATNAAKHGALSAPHGHVELTWARTESGLTLRWAERGGPRAAPPSGCGFGSRVIEQVVRYQLDGEVTRDWPESGLVCTIQLPAACLAGSEGGASGSRARQPNAASAVS